MLLNSSERGQEIVPDRSYRRGSPQNSNDTNEGFVQKGRHRRRLSSKKANWSRGERADGRKALLDSKQESVGLQGGVTASRSSLSTYEHAKGLNTTSSLSLYEHNKGPATIYLLAN